VILVHKKLVLNFWSQVKRAMSSRIRWQFNHRWHCVKGATRGVLVFYPEWDPSCDTYSFSTWLRQLNYHFPLTDWQLDCSKMYSGCRQVCSLHTKLTGAVTGVEFNPWKQQMHFAIDQLNCWHSSAIWSAYKNIYIQKILKIHWICSLLKIDTLNFLLLCRWWSSIAILWDSRKFKREGNKVICRWWPKWLELRSVNSHLQQMAGLASCRESNSCSQDSDRIYLPASTSSETIDE
jgi:hypothetical protein